MTRFTTDNTQGYTQTQLDELNRRFYELAVKPSGLPWTEGEERGIAENVQDDFDTELSAAAAHRDCQNAMQTLAVMAADAGKLAAAPSLLHIVSLLLSDDPDDDRTAKLLARQAVDSLIKETGVSNA